MPTLFDPLKLGPYTLRKVTPRPDNSTGGSHQEANGPCITVQLTGSRDVVNLAGGNAELNFINTRIATPTATPTNTPTRTPTNTPVTPTARPAARRTPRRRAR